MTKIPERFPCAVSWIKFPLIVFAFPVIKLKNQLFAELCWAGQGTCCFFYLCSWWKCIKPGSFLSNFTPPSAMANLCWFLCRMIVWIRKAGGCTAEAMVEESLWQWKYWQRFGPFSDLLSQSVCEAIILQRGFCILFLEVS